MPSAPSSPPAPVTASRGSDIVDPGGKQACDAMRRGEESGKTSDPAALIALAYEVADLARYSTDFDIRFRGQMLRDHADLAQASAGRSDGPKYAIALLTEAVRFHTQCVEAHLWGA